MSGRYTWSTRHRDHFLILWNLEQIFSAHYQLSRVSKAKPYNICTISSCLRIVKRSAYFSLTFNMAMPQPLTDVYKFWSYKSQNFSNAGSAIKNKIKHKIENSKLEDILSSFFLVDIAKSIEFIWVRSKSTKYKCAPYASLLAGQTLLQIYLLEMIATRVLHCLP